MCLNCAFSKNNKPSKSKECSVCIRNPKFLSKKRQNLMYENKKLKKPIDMYISKEFHEIIKERLLKLRIEFQDVLSKMQDNSSYPYWQTSSPIDTSGNTTSYKVNTTYSIPIVTNVNWKTRKIKRRKRGKKLETKKVSSN
ncbi:MAG: hypothetical protein DRP09_21160 [Candidatus Thorarchaeota archaeon]|nr:MAG: hypothetical protein DRP09_21160 [Candidatus Thorarchaeota archaeon]